MGRSRNDQKASHPLKPKKWIQKKLMLSWPDFIAWPLVEES